MATQIFENNIPELQQVYSKFPAYEGQSILTQLISTKRTDLGSFEISNLVFPDMHLMDVRWSVPNELVIHESNASQTIDINFILKGNIKGSYKGLDTDLDLLSGTNNLKYTPSQKSSHHAVRQDVNMFAIAVEKSYFQNLIGHDNAWAEDIQRKIEKNEDFFASDKFMTMTPKMHALIHSIRAMKQGPMTRIMTQSLVFELIAQQIEQLTLCSEIITGNDLEKLYHAKDYIERNFLEELTLTGVCREVMLNEFKLKKGFRSLFDTSVIQYVRQLRMEFAKRLLQDNKMRVEEVARKLGYRYANHFSVAYKKYFGAVPSERG